MPNPVPETPTRPAKAIPPGRDRLQSRLLVGLMLPLLIVPSIYCINVAVATNNIDPSLRVAIGVSLTFGLLVWALRAATPAAAACGGMICLLITGGTVWSDRSILRTGLTPLMALFILTFLATRAGKAKKAKLGLAEPKRGRSASQVIANLGAGVIILLIQYTRWLDRLAPWRDAFAATTPLAAAMVLAALAEATADTVSSEIGQAFGGSPILLTSLRRVTPGTDGAITRLGTAAGIFAAAIVVLTGAWSMRLTPLHAFLALAGGVFGLFFDSLLGATIERKGWLGNDLVNFTSTLAAAAFTFGAIALL